MSLYSKTTPVGFVAATQAALNSNDASIDNVFITEEDMNKDGLPFVILVAPNGGKWKVSVNNGGTVITTAV